VGGKDVPVRADSICIHSDTPNAVAVAQAVAAAVKPYVDAA
jgi:5-oxoprolinase (ATP-hydrolysing) subunit A